MEQFLDIPVTQGKVVVEPDGVLDDGHWETVAVELGVEHGELGYPDPVKATQPVGAAETTLPGRVSVVSTSRVYFFFIGAIMHICFLPMVLTMPPPLVHIAAVIFGVIGLLIMVVLGAAIAVEATLSVRAIRPIMILVIPPSYTPIV